MLKAEGEGAIPNPQPKPPTPTKYHCSSGQILQCSNAEILILFPFTKQKGNSNLPFYPPFILFSED